MVAVGQWGPEPFLDRRGRPLTSLAITVYETDEVTFASLYTDQTGVAALSNPLPTGVATTAAGLDVRGNGSFYAEPGPYVLAVSYSGTEVYRASITVATDDDFAGVLAWPLDNTGATAAEDAMTLDVTGDTNNRFVINHDGSIELGSGSAAADVTLSRSGTGTLGLTGSALSFLSTDGYIQLIDGGIYWDPVLAGYSASFNYFQLDMANPEGSLQVLPESWNIIHTAAYSSTATVMEFAKQPFNALRWKLSADTSLNWGVSGVYDTTLVRGTSGGLTTTWTNAAAVGHTVKGAAAQSADLQQWQNSSGTLLAHVKSDGAFEVVNGTFGGVGRWVTLLPTATSSLVMAEVWNGGFAPSDYSNAYFQVQLGSDSYMAIDDLELKSDGSKFYTRWPLLLNPTTASFVPLIIKGAAAQTADLQEWQDSTGAVLSSIDTTGAIKSGGSALQIKRSNGNTLAYFAFDNWYAGSIYHRAIDGNCALEVRSVTAAGKVVKVRGTTAQTAVLQEWDDVNDVVLAEVAASGRILSRSTASVNIGAIAHTSNGSNIVGFVQDSGEAGTVLSHTFNDTGRQWQMGVTFFRDVGNRFAVETGSSPNLRIQAFNAAHVPFRVKGEAAQTANLTEWQDSTGAVKASVDSAGGLVSGGQAWNSPAGVQGAAIWWTGNKPTMQISGAGADGGILHVRTGGDATFTLNGDTRVATFNSNVGTRFEPASSSLIGLIIRGLAAQTGNIQDWQNSSGSTLMRLSAGGTLTSAGGAAFGATTAGGSTHFLLAPTNAGDVGLKIIGFTGQTADLQQWQSPSSVTIASVDKDGLGLFAGLSITDAKDVVLGTTTGTKIGTATTQKIGFYNATPIVQGASIADPTGGATVDSEARIAINALISRLEALGVIATV